MASPHTRKPGLWHPGRRLNPWLAATIVGTLIVWCIVIIAILRVMA